MNESHLKLDFHSVRITVGNLLWNHCGSREALKMVSGFNLASRQDFDHSLINTDKNNELPIILYQILAVSSKKT